MFKIYFNSIHVQHVKFNTVANLSRLCVGLLERNIQKPLLQLFLLLEGLKLYIPKENFVLLYTFHMTF